MNIAAITTFPNSAWEIYAKSMLQSYVAYWPEEIPLLVQLDDDRLLSDVERSIRSQDALAVDRTKEHREFVERNAGKDDKLNYRQQPVRFCHKVFALHRAYTAAAQQKAAGQEAPRYLIWLDADVITNRKVTLDEIKECLPKEGDAVAYLGRKDWPHSECGWLAFDLENGGDQIISDMMFIYTSDLVLEAPQQHDSWIFDMVTAESEDKKTSTKKKTNLSPEAKGLDAWGASPMAKWSTHHKGPVAKNKLIEPRTRTIPQSNFVINTQNSIPDDGIRDNIIKNQELIKEWIRPCKAVDEEIVVVSAGPMLVAEDVSKEKGKVVAVKHALGPLKRAGIKPWACILLDPRDHVYDFVKDPDPEIIYFVASQVQPKVTEKLLSSGCQVYGYHASVNAGEAELIAKQPYAIVRGGSATATRGLFVLNHLGFSKMKLYGYDLCLPDKPDLNALDDKGQPKFMEISLALNDPLYELKRCFWTEPQLIAQYQEINDIIMHDKLELKAYGNGIVPFLVKGKEISDLRHKQLRDKICGTKLPHYRKIVRCSRKKETRRLIKLLPKRLRSLLRMT